MHRTERKTEQTRQPDQERRQKQRDRQTDEAAEWAQTVEAILTGGNWEQLPSARILGLSGVMGNAALAELFAMRKTGPELAERELPRGECTASPAELDDPGAPLLVSPQEGLAGSPLGNAQPLTL